MDQKKYLVTGGAGFIGSALVGRLARAGHSVRVLDNNFRGSPERFSEVAGAVEMVQADIRDAQAVQDACRGMDGVWHLAFVNGTEFFYSKPELVLDIGVKGMVNVLEGCIRHDVSELFLASSSEVYQTPPAVPTDETVPFSVPDPLNPRYSYGGGKIISELMTINYGRKHFDRALIFRPHNVYGPDMGWEHVIPQFAMRLIELCGANSGKHIFFPIQGTGAETRAFIFIDDFIDGLMLLRERGEHLGIYHVGTMEEVTISQVAGQIAAYFGRDITLIPGKLAAGGTVRRCPDIKKIRRLGFSPKVSLAEGVIATMKWYDENAHKRSRMRTGE